VEPVVWCGCYAFLPPFEDLASLLSVNTQPGAGFAMYRLAGQGLHLRPLLLLLFWPQFLHFHLGLCFSRQETS